MAQNTNPMSKGPNVVRVSMSRSAINISSELIASWYDWERGDEAEGTSVPPRSAMEGLFYSHHYPPDTNASQLLPINGNMMRKLEIISRYFIDCRCIQGVL